MLAFLTRQRIAQKGFCKSLFSTVDIFSVTHSALFRHTGKNCVEMVGAPVTTTECLCVALTNILKPKQSLHIYCSWLADSPFVIRVFYQLTKVRIYGIDDRGSVL